jgi:hypothetical protein
MRQEHQMSFTQYLENALLEHVTLSHAPVDSLVITVQVDCSFGQTTSLSMTSKPSTTNLGETSRSRYPREKVSASFLISNMRNPAHLS